MTIGEKIRAIRKEKDMTLTEVAEAASCTASLLSQAERNLTNPSVTTLRNICKALQIPLFALFDEGKFNDVMQNALVTSKEQQIVTNSSDDWQMTLLTPSPKRKFDMVVLEAEPGTVSGEPSPHAGDEAIYILQGAMDSEIDGQVYHVTKGSSIYYDATKPHCWKSVGEEKMVAIAVISTPIL